MMKDYKTVQDTAQKDTFWHYALVVNSYNRLHDRCRIARAKYDMLYGKGSFRRLRRYKDPRTGEIRKTIEIEAR